MNRQADPPTLDVAADVPAAVEAALQIVRRDDLLCFAGSLAIAGEARTALTARQKELRGRMPVRA
jgi:hypothetical protein